MNITEWSKKIVGSIKGDLEKGDSYRKSTCDSNSYGWSSSEHHAMASVAQAFREKGHRVSRNVNHGVTDWEVFPLVEVEI